MRQRNAELIASIAALAATLGLTVLAGCSNSTGSGSGPAATDKSAPAGGGAAGGDGAQLVQAKCGCHNGGKAPSLANIGAKHDQGWLAEFIADPKSKDPGSRMPSMAGKVTTEEIATIAKYLASQK